MFSGSVETRRIGANGRWTSVVLVLAISGFAALRFWTEGGVFGQVSSAVIAIIALWSTAYTLIVPELVAMADGSGLAYTDMHRSWLLSFSDERAGWSDVLEVNTDRLATRYSWFLRTRIKVRAPGGDGTRTITTTSRYTNYEPFLRALREGTAGGAVVVKGYGFVEGGIRSVPRKGSPFLKAFVVGLVVLVTIIPLLRLFLR
jgi:hypothetical protein